MIYMIHDLIVFVILVVDKMAGNGTDLEGRVGTNCSLTQLYRKKHKCRNDTHQAVG